MVCEALAVLCHITCPLCLFIWSPFRSPCLESRAWPIRNAAPPSLKTAKRTTSENTCKLHETCAGWMLMLVQIMLDKTWNLVPKLWQCCVSKGNIFNDDPKMRFRKKKKKKVFLLYFQWLWMNKIEPKIVQLSRMLCRRQFNHCGSVGNGGVILVTGLGLESCEHKAFLFWLTCPLSQWGKKNPLFVVHCLLHIWTLFSSDAEYAALPQLFSQWLFHLNINQLYVSHKSRSLWT